MTVLSNLIATRDAEYRAADALLADAEKRGGFTPADQAQFDAHSRTLAELDTRIADVKAVEDRSQRVDAAASRYERSAPANRPASSLDAFLAGEVRSIDVDLGSVSREMRDLSKGSSTAGGNTVPTSFVDQLYAHLIESSAIRQTNVTVFTTQSGEDLQVPKTTSHSTATLTAENVALTESDPAFGLTTLGAFKYGIRIDVTNELLNDSGIDLTSYLAEQAGRALGNASGAHFITGDGSGKPNGAVTASSLGKTGGTGVAGAFTSDDLVDLLFSVIPEHRRRGYWLMNDQTLADVRKLKDANDNFLFVPNNAGGPDMLLGRPIVTDPNVADVGLSAKSLLFGDFSAYAIRDVRGVRFERSVDFAWDRDVTVFRAILRTDGDLIGNSGAIKHFVGGAS